MNYFKFNNKFYKHKSVLSVGNPLSGILACLFVEFGPIKYRLPINATSFIYIDNILISLPQNIKIEKIAEKLINVELLYSRNTSISRNIIKHNLWTSMNEKAHFFIKNISLTLYPQKSWCFCDVWGMGEDRDRLLY